MNEKLTKDSLTSKFTDGCKVNKDWKIGTEHEKFGFIKKNLSPINIKDIQKIFLKLSDNYGWKKVYENTNIIELRKMVPLLL